MQLAIRRSQQDVKGMLGGHKGVSFSLAYRLILTPDEAELVKRYKMEDHVVTWTTFEGNQIAGDTIKGMLEGRTQTVSDVTTLIRNEDVLKDACDSLYLLFQVARSFGGEEVVDFPR